MNCKKTIIRIQIKTNYIRDSQNKKYIQSKDKIDIKQIRTAVTGDNRRKHSKA